MTRISDMTRTICFDTAAALRDRRFRRKLTKFEGMDFVFLLGFAGLECRDPAFIPAKKMEDLALDLGWTGKAGEEQKRKRLAKWSAPGIELIEIQEDGGIQINYLLDQEFEEEEEMHSAPATSNGNGMSNGLNGAGGMNGSENNVNGSEKRGGGERRQQNRRYKQNPDAVRQRKSYRERKMKEAGIPDFAPGAESSPAGEFKNLTEETENLTLSASKPHASGEENGANSTENLTLPREVLPARVGDVRNVVGEFKNSLSSDNVSNVSREENLTQNLTQNLTLSGQNLPPAAKNSAAASGRPAAPPPRPAIRADEVHLVRQIDVSAVLKGTGDDPATWKAQWVALWNHCYSHGQLKCWDQGVAYLAYRLKVSPGSGPGSVGKAGPLTRGTILPLLEKAGAPYVPKSKGEPAPEEPVDPAEQARVHQEIMDIQAEWQAEEQARESALRGVITPLAVREDGDTEPEMEDG